MESSANKLNNNAWIVKVPLRDELLKVIPVKKLQSRAVMGIILGYLDCKVEIVHIF